MPTLDGMPTLILVRHGRSTANTEGLLAGWTPGVALDERGATQAAALPGRLAELPLSEVVSSPLQRCQETIRPLLDVRPGLHGPHRRTDRGVSLRRLVRTQARRAQRASR
ncbi:2,3-bisphosphoglycerate-dependent phosphoglycerate mutase [Streptomyces alboniger]